VGKSKLRRTTVSLRADDLERLEKLVGLSTTDRIRKAIRIASYVRECVETKEGQMAHPIDPRALRSLL
jgi:hypothetical protein